MQCKDIPDLPILAFVAKHGGIGCNWFEIDRDNPRSVRHAMPDNLPEKLIHAKMRQLIHRRVIEGCDCGCRGDFEITDKGRGLLS